MSATLNQLEQKIRGAVEADEETGHYRCDRGIFTDKDLFDLEIGYFWHMKAKFPKSVTITLLQLVASRLLLRVTKTAT